MTDVKSNKPAPTPKAPPQPPPPPPPAEPQLARDVAGAGRAIEGVAMAADQFIKDRLADGEALAGNHDLARFASGVVHALTSNVTGVVGLAGSALQLAEQETRDEAGQALQAIAADPGAVAQELWSSLEEAYHEDPAKLSGEIVGSLIPIGAALKAATTAGKAGQAARILHGAGQVLDDAARAARAAGSVADDAARVAAGLADDAARAAKGPRILSQDALQKLNASVEPLADMMADEAREQAFKALYQDADLQHAASEAITQWVMGGKDQVPIREAFAALKQGGDHPMRETVEQLLETRKARWDRLAAQQGLERPTHFRLFRGVQSEHAMEELVQAWETPGRKGLQLQHHSVNSWSTNPSVAKDLFASGGDTAVVYQADIPFGRTLADKWADGAGFLKWTPEQDEVIVATKGLTVPAEQVRAVFQGKTYGFEDREALIAAWRATHPRP